MRTPMDLTGPWCSAYHRRSPRPAQAHPLRAGATGRGQRRHRALRGGGGLHRERLLTSITSPSRSTGARAGDGWSSAPTAGRARRRRTTDAHFERLVSRCLRAAIAAVTMTVICRAAAPRTRSAPDEASASANPSHRGSPTPTTGGHCPAPSGCTARSEDAPNSFLQLRGGRRRRADRHPPAPPP